MMTRATPLPSQASIVCEIANAAAELHAQFDARQNFIDRLRIHRLAGEGAVEIDDMEMREALARESFRLRRRVFVEDGRLVHIALEQADAFARFEIDRGIKNHGRHLRKLAIKASPMDWLFSGWNCVPTILSRPTIAMMGPP